MTLTTGAVPRASAVCLLSLLLLGACATRNPVPERRPAKPAPADPSDDAPGMDRDLTDRVVAEVGPTRIRESDIGQFVIRYFRDRANEALTHLIDAAILEREAREVGITVPPELLRQEVERQLADREKAVQAQFGAEVTLETYLRDRYGISVAEHREDLSGLVRTRMQRDRVIRYSQLRRERVRVRDAIFSDKDIASRAAKSARDGADLGRLAEDSGRGSRVLPLLGRGEFAPDALGAAAFALPVGGVSEPITDDARFHVLKVIARIPAREGSWESLSEEIEAGIKNGPVEQWEYTLWAREMREKHRARVLR